MCVHAPFGTVGIFTIITLNRDSGEAAFTGDDASEVKHRQRVGPWHGY